LAFVSHLPFLFSFSSFCSRSLFRILSLNNNIQSTDYSSIGITRQKPAVSPPPADLDIPPTNTINRISIASRFSLPNKPPDVDHGKGPHPGAVSSSGRR
jgi:hypothetical protein